jgi:organic radical activating enzyme
MSNEDRIEILKNKKTQINDVSPSFCTAKWLQTTLYLQNGFNHSCHHPSPHKIPIEEVEIDPAALSNSNYKKALRKQMLEGIRPSECDYCWKIEDLDKEYFSDRHYKTSDYWAWDRFNEIANSNSSENINPSYLEVSFSNACNFKCAYCSPEVSSKWLEEIKEFGPYPTTQSNHNLDWLKKVGKYPYKNSDNNPYVNAFWKWFPNILPTLKVFRITGGEPLMSKDIWKVFEYLRNNPQPNLELAINSNLCVEQKLFDRFLEEINNLGNSVKKIDIYTSLESVGERAEYVRFGLNYNQWCRNVRTILSQTSHDVLIMTTVNALSVSTMVDFLELIMQFRREFNNTFEKNRIPISINYLRWPPYLDARILPNDLKKDLAKKIFDKSENCTKYFSQDKYARIYLEESDQIKRFCEYLIQDGDYTEQKIDFINFINEYDKRKSTNFIEVFTELSMLLKE